MISQRWQEVTGKLKAHAETHVRDLCTIGETLWINRPLGAKGKQIGRQALLEQFTGVQRTCARYALGARAFVAVAQSYGVELLDAGSVSASLADKLTVKGTPKREGVLALCKAVQLTGKERTGAVDAALRLCGERGVKLAEAQLVQRAKARQARVDAKVGKQLYEADSVLYASLLAAQEQMVEVG